jgi:hypothetical protein
MNYVFLYQKVVMKKKNLLFIALPVLVIALISATLNSGGSPGAKTGSPLDGNNCTQCHSGLPIDMENLISTDIPETGYIPGTTYTISFCAANPAAQKMGFEFTAENAENKVGTFIITNSTDSKLANADKAVTHNGVVNSNAYNWSFDWTAPVAGTGEVTFYGAANTVNGNGGTSGDQVFLSSLSVEEDVSSGIQTDLNATVSIYTDYKNGYVRIAAKNLLRTVKVFDINGKLLKSLSDLNHSEINVNTQSLKKGIYLFEIGFDSYQITKKAVLN